MGYAHTCATWRHETRYAHPTIEKKEPISTPLDPVYLVSQRVYKPWTKLSILFKSQEFFSLGQFEVNMVSYCDPKSRQQYLCNSFVDSEPLEASHECTTLPRKSPQLDSNLSVIARQPQPNKWVICAYDHTKLQTEQSRYWSDNYYYRRTQSKTIAYLNCSWNLKYTVWAYSPKSKYYTLTNHLSKDDKSYWNLTMSPWPSARTAKSVKWIADLYLIQLTLEHYAIALST